jgi:hypothetical protein
MFVVIAESDGPPCAPDSHDWWVVEQDGITWRTCLSCTYTECTAPGVDKCLWVEQPTAAPGTPERMNQLLSDELGRCVRLTTQHCADCDTPRCSDHSRLAAGKVLCFACADAVR